MEKRASYCYGIIYLLLPNFLKICTATGCHYLGHARNQIYRFLYSQLRFNNLFCQEFFMFLEIFAFLFDVVILNGGLWDEFSDLFLVFKAYRPRYTDYLCKWISKPYPYNFIDNWNNINKIPFFSQKCYTDVTISCIIPKQFVLIIRSDYMNNLSYSTPNVMGSK